MGTLLYDLRYGIRMLIRQRVFALLAITTLALGIGANSAMFALVNAVLLRPLPFAEPERIVSIEEVIARISPRGMPVTPSDLREFQRGSQAFEAVAGYSGTSMDLTGAGQPERVETLRVSPQIFSVLGVSPVKGRAFFPAEDRPGSGVAIISYKLWQERFAGDPAIAGRVVEFDRHPTTIVGVLAKNVEFPLPGLTFGGGHDVWIPLGLTQAEISFIGNYNYAVVARLKPGASLSQAQDDVRATVRRIAESIPVALRAGVTLDAKVTPVAEQIASGSRELLWLLLGAVGLVLLIACVNVAGLLLERAAGRARELAIRSSLGASSARLLRQLITESLLLSITGGAAGLLLAMWLVALMSRVIPASVPRAATIDIDWHVCVFTVVVSALAGLLFGVMPAVMAAGRSQAARLKEASRGATAGRAQARFRTVLIAGEVALSLMLLVGAGLLVRSLIAIRGVKPGFDVQHVLTARVTLPAAAYPRADAARGFFDRAVAALEALPGVSAAGAATAPLLTLRGQSLFSVKDPAIPAALAANSTILGDFFQAAGIRLQRGRFFDSRDRQDSAAVVIINETLARQYFPGRDPIGQQIKFGNPALPGSWSTVIGVVADVKNNDLANNVKPAVYQPYSQIPADQKALGLGASMVLAVKAASDPDALTYAVRTAIARLDPQLPVSGLQTMRAQVEASLAPEWFQTGLAASFAGLALLLAAIGIYGVVSVAVTQRTQEIGVRMALGATQRGVLGLIMGQGMRVVAVGIAFGLLGSFALTKFMSGFLFGVRPTDWVTFLLAPAVLCAVALAANLAPARRAAGVDAMVALRYE